MLNNQSDIVEGGAEGPLGGHRRALWWNGQQWEGNEIEFGFQEMAGIKADETPYEIEVGERQFHDILKHFHVSPGLFPNLFVVKHLSPMVLRKLAE